jgi:arginyl-tRNA synthetase
MMTEIRADTADFIHKKISEQYGISTLKKDQIAALLENPKKLEHGHLAFPVFFLAKELRKAPPVIAQEIAAIFSGAKTPQIELVTPVGGYVNFTFRDEYLQKVLVKAVHESGDRLGYTETGSGKNLVIDYSSPNVAKPMHVGHLRATVIGQAIRNLAQTQGYNVIGLNHLGDWGVQFGKLAWAFKEWGGEYDFAGQPFRSLYEIYVRFHDEAEKNPELEVKGSAVFKQLEQGDVEVTALWRKFVDISMLEYQRIWNLMGVKHDLVRGESFYSDKMKPVEKILEEKGLLVESEGASVVMLGDDMPPCLIRKSDGASLYATRDLASAIYRHDVLKADINLYVVGVDQTLHFKQVFKVLELMGYDWAKNCHHIAFGMYRFKDVGKMSSRKGNVIFLEDVVKQAIEMVEKVIAEKNPNLANARQVAEQVGVGAIIFNDLASDRVKNVDFDWEKVLNFEGDSGPYVQYCHVRCASLIRKYGDKYDGKVPPKTFTTDLKSSDERELVRLLLGYQDTLAAAFNQYRPNVLAHYLLEVCAAFNRFYQKNRILGEAPDVEASRMALVDATRLILKMGLKTLNIEAPDVM